MRGRFGNVKVVGKARIKIGKHFVRPEDQTRYTVPSLDQRRQERRIKNKQARAARRRNKR